MHIYIQWHITEETTSMTRTPITVSMLAHRDVKGFHVFKITAKDVN